MSVVLCNMSLVLYVVRICGALRRSMAMEKVKRVCADRLGAMKDGREA
jgi:hypothetical protein